MVDTITTWGREGGYFADDAEADAFSAELKYILVTQRAAFNSPVWFNIGVKGVPQQATACFILSVDDTMDSILNWYREEGVIFKGGSGSGVNLSKIRSSVELLEGGGTASGPVSFMRGADASAGTIKSGGKTRRAAKMVILDVDHPDIEEFVWCKVKEERKARVLRDAGFDMDLDGSDSYSIQYQNANNSVRVTDEFMQAVARRRRLGPRRRHDRRGGAHGSALATCGGRSPRRRGSAPTPASSSTPRSTDGTPPTRRVGSMPATRAPSTCTSTTQRAIWRRSTCSSTSTDDGSFDVDAYMHTIEIVFTAQEILVGRADYPTPRSARRAASSVSSASATPTSAPC